MYLHIYGTYRLSVSFSGRYRAWIVSWKPRSGLQRVDGPWNYMGTFFIYVDMATFLLERLKDLSDYQNRFKPLSSDCFLILVLQLTLLWHEPLWPSVFPSAKRKQEVLSYDCIEHYKWKCNQSPGIGPHTKQAASLSPQPHQFPKTAHKVFSGPVSLRGLDCPTTGSTEAQFKSKSQATMSCICFLLETWYFCSTLYFSGYFIAIISFVPLKRIRLVFLLSL